MEEVERRAEAVLEQVPSWIWDGESLPVPIEEIADTCFGLYVRDVEDLTAAPGAPELEPGQTLSGLLLADRGEIWVNADEARQWPPRRRFTIGHELGHWVMHRTGQQSLFCRSATVQPDEDRPPRPPSPRHRGGGERLRRRPADARAPGPQQYERDRDIERCASCSTLRGGDGPAAACGDLRPGTIR